MNHDREMTVPCTSLAGSAREALEPFAGLETQGAGEDGYRTVFNGLLKEAATRIASDAKRIAELEAERDDLKADYLRRHKDACDRFEEVASLQRALAEERERCAMIAERHAYCHPNAGVLGPEMNSIAIATAIRSGKPDGKE